MINKKCLALAISAIMFSGTSNAAINLNGGGGKAPVYANEIAIAGTKNLENLEGIFNTTADMGFGISAGAVRYIRYDLSNGATFTTSPAAPVITISSATPDDDINTSVTLSSGGAGESFVIYQVTADPDFFPGILQTDEADLKMSNITVTSKDSVSITFSHYELASNAVDSTNALATSSANIISWSTSVGYSCIPDSGSNKIDVAQSSLFFDGSTGDVNTEIGRFSVNFVNNRIANGSFLGTIDSIVSSADITISGSDGWSAITTLADGANTFALAGADFVYTSVLLSSYVPGRIFKASVPAANAVPIIASTATLTITPTAVAGYDVSGVTGSCILGEMSKNGSHDRLTFGLKPNGAFKNFVRISNPSATAGDIYLTITDDKGTKSNFPLGDITALSNSLAAGASTALININDIADAALAANAAYDVTTKMRIDVDAEFGTSGAKLTGVSVPSTQLPTAPGPHLSTLPAANAAWANTAVVIGGLNALPNAMASALSSATIMESETGVNIQAFAMSKDNNSFFMLQKD